MQTLKARLRPRSAFGTPLRGDTLFGQLCWALRRAEGEAALASLLEGYTEGQPALVVSDAFPAGHLPLPALPQTRYAIPAGEERKRLKRRRWIAAEHVSAPLRDWLGLAVGDADISPDGVWHSHGQPHNTLNRLTGTTGTGPFAPYVMEALWPAPKLELDLYVAVDTDRLQAAQFARLLEDVGAGGYGRDASIGLGKFEVQDVGQAEWPGQPDANAWLTLAPLAPQGLGWRENECFYRPLTHFGRHGDLAGQRGQPFKTPLLLADTGALLSPTEFLTRPWSGQGLGGAGMLSRAIPETVHQGYAPVIAVRMEESA